MICAPSGEICGSDTVSRSRYMSSVIRSDAGTCAAMTAGSDARTTAQTKRFINPPCWEADCISLAFAADHHLGRFDDRHRLVAALQLQFAQRVAGDHGRERLVGDAQANLRQKSVHPDFVDDAAQLVTA